MTKKERQSVNIAIDASRAFLHERTGIEEYSYQVIRHLRAEIGSERVTLFLRRGTAENIDFDLPECWRVKELWAPRLWTYARLSLALLWHRPTHLFVPGHIVPPIHPKNTTVVIHGLEYEMCPEAYSPYERWSMRRGIRNSCRWARSILCVSNNTKRDVMRLYNVPREKIRVAYEGVNPAPQEDKQVTHDTLTTFDLRKQDYLIFVGRIEERKNISNILKAYEIMRAHFLLPQKLVLVGKAGLGYEQIREEIVHHPFAVDIILTGFVTDAQKWSLLRHAAVCVFPTLYEGFGLPVLEAQQVGVPVVTSENSSLQEVAGDSALLVDPGNVAQIAERVYTLITDMDARSDIITRGFSNTKRFAWTRHAHLAAKLLLRK